VTIYNNATLRPDPAAGATSAPPDIVAGFCGEERKGKEGRKGRREKNGKGKAVTRIRRGGQGEGDNGKGWRRNGGEMKEEKGKGKNFVQL